MQEHIHKFKGVWPVFVTPYHDNLKIDISTYRAMIEWQLNFDIGGIYANCSSSEMYELDSDERLLLITEAVKTAKGQLPVAATGNFGQSVDEHIEFCKKVEDTGADIVMLTIPTLYQNDQQLEEYFMRVAEETTTPLGLYECPVPRPYHLPLELIEKLAKSGRFFAYKETSCDLDKIKSILKITKDTPLSLLQANVPYLLESIRAGAPGTMNIVANWLPDLVISVVKKGLNGDSQTERLNHILCAMELAQRSTHTAGIKYLISKRGVPIKPLTRNSQRLSKEEAHGLDLASKIWFEEDGSLVILNGR